MSNTTHITQIALPIQNGQTSASVYDIGAKYDAAGKEITTEYVKRTAGSASSLSGVLYTNVEDISIIGTKGMAGIRAVDGTQQVGQINISNYWYGSEDQYGAQMSAYDGVNKEHNQLRVSHNGPEYIVYDQEDKTETSHKIILNSTLAGTDFGVVKSGGDVTITSGMISVNDDSHQHSTSTITNWSDVRAEIVSTAQSYTNQKVADLVSSAPSVLDTLEELAAALGEDANFSTTVVSLIGERVPNSRVTDISTGLALSATSTSVVTERRVYHGLPCINNKHDYTSSSYIYTPTTGGTSSYILTATGPTATPTWTSYLNVSQGGTGRATLTAGYALIGNGNNQVNLRQIKNSTSASSLGASTALVTANAVYYGLPTINNSHQYTSSSNIYAPTTGGTSSYILTATGSTATPTWSQYLTIGQGGTGATTAAAACVNLGAVQKAGDTMTGDLIVNGTVTVGATATFEYNTSDKCIDVIFS